MVGDEIKITYFYLLLKMDALPTDLLLEILLRTDDSSLQNFCSTNTKLYQICHSDYFWQQRISNLSPRLLFTEHQETSWKNFYLSLVKGGSINILSITTINTFDTDILIDSNSSYQLFNKHYILNDTRKYLKAMICESTHLDKYLIRLTVDGFLIITNLLTGKHKLHANVLDIVDIARHTLLIIKSNTTLLRWMYSINSMQTTSVIELNFSLRKICAAASLSGNTLLIGTDNNLYLLSGNKVHLVPGIAKLGKIVDGGLIFGNAFVLTESGQLYAIPRIATGSTEPQLIKYNSHSPIISLNCSFIYLYGLNRDGTISIFDTREFELDAIPIINPDIVANGNFIKIIGSQQSAYAITDDFKLYSLKGFTRDTNTLIETEVIDAHGGIDSIVYIKKTY